MKNYKRTKLACYTAYFTMSSVFVLPPLLFVTFHQRYGISYTLLGTLVLTNFCTQMVIDLIFTLFSKYFNVKWTVRIMPLITALGFAVYGLTPILIPENIYVGLFLGTVIFSVSSGLSEVLLSPVIAALPSDNSQRDMSLLHSLYAFGVLAVVLISSLYFALFGRENWMYLAFFFAALPLTATVLFFVSPMPDMNGADSGEKRAKSKKKYIGLALCAGCIFFGSCTENTMSNWISGYMENALQIDKSLGDILGMAGFAVLLGLMRVFYAKFGKNITKVLLVGMLGAVCCYLVAGLAPGVWAPLIACVLTGLFTAMLWPGSLIMMEENIPGVSVAGYALMAAGGDLGASVAPQTMGIVVDTVSASELAKNLSLTTGWTADQIGMKAGMLFSTLFPLLGVGCLLITMLCFRKMKK